MKKLILDELNRKNIEEFKCSDKTPIIVILDDIRSMHNIGSFFRTADGFLIEKIYLCGITAQPPHKEIRKTALGATESVDWEYRKSSIELVKELQEKNIQVIAAEQTEGSEKLHQLTIEKNTTYALVFGNEVKGVNQEIIDCANKIVEIPQAGTKHSFNVSISGGILLWEFYKKLELKG